MLESIDTPGRKAAHMVADLLDTGDFDPRVGMWGPSLPWLLAVRLRILIVMDGRINITFGRYDFGLGFVLQALRDIAWWVKLDITSAHRGNVPPVNVDGQIVEPDMQNFRFTQDGFDINGYDQVWFFGDEPKTAGNDRSFPDSRISDPAYAPLSDAELLIVAEWMDRGGGVFAAGDHSVLGAPMCHRIPRVRKMRRWTHAQGVPVFNDVDTHETLVPATGGNPDIWEGDRWPQRIYPVLRPTNDWLGVRKKPHPVLCGREGVVDHFPDHMHEGGIFEDNEVELDDPIDIPDYGGPEFPMLGGKRPRPEVIAHGLTTRESPPGRFPMVSVYDGDYVAVGRVIVDSTWHHWFSMNLWGLRAQARHHWAGMVDYYRNVALWLATPYQRSRMLFAATWGVVIGSHPGLFDASLGIRGIGERVLDVIGRSAPHCIVDQIVKPVVALPQLSHAADDNTWMWAPSPEAIKVAVVGAIAEQLIPRAHKLFDALVRGDEDIDFDINQVLELSSRGAEVGRSMLLEGMAESARYFASAAENGATAESAPMSGNVVVDQLEEGWWGLDGVWDYPETGESITEIR